MIQGLKMCVTYQRTNQYKRNVSGHVRDAR